MNGLRIAFSLLTIIPTGKIRWSEGCTGRAAYWFPWVGLVIGMALLGANWLLTRCLPPQVAAALVVGLWAALTGGLHLDGLTDCGDGLLSAAAPRASLWRSRPRWGDGALCWWGGCRARVRAAWGRIFARA